jgi:spermidine synthase
VNFREIRLQQRSHHLRWQTTLTPVAQSATVTVEFLHETAVMRSWELLAEACTPDGTTMRLTRQGNEYAIMVNARTLMSSRMHGSEEALAAIACQRARTLQQPRVLVGGLGMGFTLRATLDLLPPDALVRVVELVPAVIEWNRGLLGPMAGHPLDDPRVRIEVGDVGFTLRANPGGFDAILLDVDNGPAALTTLANHGLYDNGGVAAAYAALRIGGALAVWSAWDDRKFEQRLRFHGFVAQVDRVRARLKKGGVRHTIFLGLKQTHQGSRSAGALPDIDPD